MAERVDDDSVRSRQTGADGRTIVAGKALRPVTRECGDHAGHSVHPPHAIGSGLAYEKITDGVHRESEWRKQARTCGSATVARETRDAVARCHRQDPGGVIHAEQHALTVRSHIEVAV